MNPYMIKVFSGTSNPLLSAEVAQKLGVPLGKAEIKRFADQEIGVQIGENVRGCDVFLIQACSPPANDHLMEVLLMIDACRRASAKRITAVIPYYCYARQDRKTKPRVPISAALVAHMLEAAGADRVLSVDLHCGQIQGFFKIPVDNLYGQGVLAQEMMKVWTKTPDVGLTIVSPDAGGTERAELFRKILKANFGLTTSMAVMNKQRVEANKVAKMELVGEVKGTDCFLVDDMIDTAGTLVAAAQVLKDNGACKVYAAITHPLLNHPACEKIENSCLEKIIVCNTIPIPKEKVSTKLVQVSVAKMLAESIRRVHNEESISNLFDEVSA